MKSHPIILITDSIPSANGGGISQTLYNLLDNYRGSIYIIASETENPLADSLPATLLRHRYQRFYLLANRLGKYVNTHINKANYNYQEKSDIQIDGLPTPDDAFILVSTTNPIKLQLAWLLHQQKGYMLIPYFMDDWMGGLTFSWKNNSIQTVVKGILAVAPAWLLISGRLKTILLARYGLAPKPCLIVHNPVAPKQVPKHVVADDGLIIYAGSIWPMHLDALVLVAKAVQTLQAAGQIKYRLLIYTSENVWRRNSPLVEGQGVSWGGFIPYNQLHDKLVQGWLLLCAASFLKENEGFSQSSVQTKLTDYMNAGRPILYVGPPGGASGEFVNRWACGFGSTVGDVQNVKNCLQNITAANWQSAALNGKEAVGSHFTKQKIQQGMYQFINQYGQLR